MEHEKHSVRQKYTEEKKQKRKRTNIAYVYQNVLSIYNNIITNYAITSAK